MLYSPGNLWGQHETQTDTSPSNSYTLLTVLLTSASAMPLPDASLSVLMAKVGLPGWHICFLQVPPPSLTLKVGGHTLQLGNIRKREATTSLGDESIARACPWGAAASCQGSLLARGHPISRHPISRAQMFWCFNPSTQMERCGHSAEGLFPEVQVGYTTGRKR